MAGATFPLKLCVKKLRGSRGDILNASSVESVYVSGSFNSWDRSKSEVAFGVSEVRETSIFVVPA